MRVIAGVLTTIIALCLWKFSLSSVDYLSHTARKLHYGGADLTYEEIYYIQQLRRHTAVKVQGVRDPEACCRSY